MKLCPCLSFLPFWWDRVYRLFAANMTTEESDIIADIVSTLPSDIIADIGSRLPAQSLKSLCSLTKTPYFLNMHLRRATPVIAYQYFCESDRQRNQVICKVVMHFSNEVTHFHQKKEEEILKIVKKAIRIDFRNTSPHGCSMPRLYGSYNGFLLFVNLFHDPVLLIHNPVTEEGITVSAGHPRYRPCGFFFNSTSEEYKTLFVLDEEAGFTFMEYGLRTESTRVFTSLSHPPDLHSFPINFNGALHWMVDDEEYKHVFGVFPGCSNSIVVFNIESGEFCTMWHPGDQCKELNIHCKMRLVEMEGHLCYCGVSKGEVVLWALENYEERVWVKRWVVDIHPMKKKCCINLKRDAIPLQMFGNELLLRLNFTDLFLYNLRLATFRRVGFKYGNLEDLDYYLYAFAHANTLVTLHGRVG